LCNWSETLLSQDPLITSLLRSHKESNLLVLDVSGGTVGSVVRNNPHALPVPRPNNTCRCRNPFQRLSFWGTATMEGVASSRLALSPPLKNSFLLSGFLNISIRRGWVSLPVLVTPHDTLIMLHVGFKLSIDLPSDQSITSVRYEEQNRTFGAQV
jgi:hypothetical protein